MLNIYFSLAVVSFFSLLITHKAKTKIFLNLESYPISIFQLFSYKHVVCRKPPYKRVWYNQVSAGVQKWLLQHIYISKRSLYDSVIPSLYLHHAFLNEWNKHTHLYKTHQNMKNTHVQLTFIAVFHESYGLLSTNLK